MDINTHEIIKRHAGGRPICALWRFDEEGKLIIQNPTRRDYNLGNYKLNRKSVCNLCNREIIWKHMKRHQETSQICKKIREGREDVSSSD